MIVNLNEVFHSIQGEAYWTGTPALFIRLQGCTVGCPWCDTKESWGVKPNLVMDEAAISDLLEKSPERHVVITGGEPFEHNIEWLIDAVVSSGKWCQVETSGTAPLPDSILRPVFCNTWLTVSPKIGYNKPLLDEVVQEADEIKYPVKTEKDVDDLLALLERISWQGSDVWLQPLSQSRRATQLCVDLAAKHGFRVSIQVHKYIGMR